MSATKRCAELALTSLDQHFAQAQAHARLQSFTGIHKKRERADIAVLRRSSSRYSELRTPSRRYGTAYGSRFLYALNRVANS